MWVFGRTNQGLKEKFRRSVQHGRDDDWHTPSMTWSSLGEVDAASAHIEQLVDLTPRIDPWCSGPDWFVSAHEAFSEDATPLTWSEAGTGAVLLSSTRMEDGAVLVTGLEPMWGFTSPFVGPDLPDLAELATEHLRGIDGWDICVIAGLPLDEDLARFMAQPFASLGQVQAVYGIIRQVADVATGHDAWFGARSAKFRKTLRQSEKRAQEAGIVFVDISEDSDAYGRCVDIEGTSWKGMSEDGITSPGMHRFYEVMTERLQRQGRFRATVASIDGQDVGFIFGGIRNGRYRGLQLSFAEAARPLSISHLLQHHTVQAVIDEGVHTYDMGMEMEYKQRWATHQEPSMSLIIHRAPSKRRGRFG